MKTLTQKQLQKLVGNKKWVMAYNRISAVVDTKTSKVMYIESYGPDNGFFIEGWRALHYGRTSLLVEKSYREGNTTICILRQGKSKLKLIPSFSPLGIEECQVKSGKVYVTLAGLGGAGVSAAFSRGLARGVLGINILNKGGGAKIGRSTLILPQKSLLLIGVDDTDNETEGATYSLVNNIAQEAALKYSVQYVIHVNIQHYPYNSRKTKNCMSTVVGLIFQTETEKRGVVELFKSQLKENTFSSQTAMAVKDGFCFDNEFMEYCTDTKFGIVGIDIAIKVAQSNGVEVFQITGKNGIIGAVASLGYFDKPDFAAKLPSFCQ